MSRALLLSIIIGLITAIVASSKGRSFWVWWIYGGLFPPFALIYALFLKRDTVTIQKEQQKKNFIQCPYCEKMVPPNTKQCNYCEKKIDVIDV